MKTEEEINKTLGDFMKALVETNDDSASLIYKGWIRGLQWVLAPKEKLEDG